jgi:outer membrane protein assembly factor BamA
VRVAGEATAAEGDLVEKLATRSDESFLGIPTTYEVYDPFVVQRDVERIERYYRARGHFDARVRGVQVIQATKGKVTVLFQLQEGPGTRVTLVRIQRAETLETAAEQAVAKAAAIQPGDTFDETNYEAMKQGIVRALQDHGYAHGKVEGGFAAADMAPEAGVRVLEPGSDEFRAVAPASDGADDDDDGPGLPPPAGSAARPDDSRAPGPGMGGGAGDGKGRGAGAGTDARRPRRSRQRFGVRVDPVHRVSSVDDDGKRTYFPASKEAEAEVYLRVIPGPLCTFGTISLEGFGDFPEAQIRRILEVKAGQKYSQSALESARGALLELGLFSTVEVVAEKPDETVSIIPISFKVTRAPLHTLTLGGGAQADVLRTDLHFVAGYQHQNFLGGLRRLTTQIRPGLVLFPTNLQNLLPTERLFPEVKAKAELRQPSFIEHRLNGTLRSEFLIYPLTLPARSAAEVPDVVVGYREIREGVGVDRSFFDGKLALAGFYNFQVSFPFSYVGPLDQGIQRLILSYLSFTQTVDLRDNPVRPRKGAYFGNEAQVAGLGGDARDFRLQPDVRFYAPISRRLTLATRASVGFLFPFSYGDTLATEPTEQQLESRAYSNQRNRDLQVLYFRGLFSGGPSSNRGYVLRGVGPRGIAPFHIGGATTQLRDCVGRVNGGVGVSGGASQVAQLAAVDPTLCGVPLGGLSAWESSVEVRAMITELFSMSFFLDASDVTRERLRLRLNYPHLSTGTGFRYDTPVGPVRLDVGYAIPGAQHLGGQLDPSVEGQPATFLGLPVAVNIAVGEAF